MEFIRYLLVIWSVLSTITVANASENIARNKATNQSSDFNDVYVSSKAVDGCALTLMGSGCCTHTLGGQTEAWWQVDLQTQSVIESVNITYRDEKTLQRLAGFEIYLSNTHDWTSRDQCYQDTTADLASMSPVQSVSCPDVARYLTIYNDRRVKAKPWYSDEAYLELCEVYVIGCPVGEYGNGNCDNACTNCLYNKCHATSGTCDVCAVGFYKVGGNCVLCPVNCERNKCDSTNGACSDGCSTGFSGTYCGCPVNCRDNTCPITYGQCNDCNDGYYGSVCTPCPFGCSSNICDKTSGNCFHCDVGFHGSHCNQPCHENCKNNICYKDTGYCVECNVGYYGMFCDQSCPGNCKSICSKDNGQCTDGCTTGFSGTRCGCPVNCGDNNCPITYGQCNDCNDGYYGSVCTPCPVGCSSTICDKISGHCLSCDVGFYGSHCSQPCHENCNNSICYKDTGQCTDCNVRFHGGFCNQSCPGNCKSMCGKDNGQCTDGCSTGFSGTRCGCPVNCGDNNCPITYGQCNECNDGYYGSVCTPCPVGCSSDICNKTSGNCLDCDAGFHGSHCNHLCHENCKNSSCHKDTGQCAECDAGYHGSFCNQSCANNCFSCNISNGQCTECNPGFHGNFCNQACPTNCKNSICSIQDGQCIETEALTQEPDSHVGTYAGAGIGAVVLLAAVIVVVIVVLRRRKLQTKKTTKSQFDDIGTALSLPRAKQEHTSHAVSKMSTPVVDGNQCEYINVCDVGNKDEEVVYSNMDTPSGVSIHDIRAMIPQKMENEEEEFKKEFMKLPWGAVHPHQEGAKVSNKPKNRFKTTFPYDHSRVILDKIGNDPDSTYINANYIDSIDATQVYVACQGPKEKTVDDFWRMAWQLNTGKIVMVTNLVEGGTIKCHQYWPDEGEPLTTKHFNITLDRERTYALYVLREISLTQRKTKQERQLHQFHFIAWPDHGTPDTLELVLFHRRVTSYRTHLTGPMVVHCSAGLGRTGTFIGLDALLKEEKKSGRVDIPRYIRTMRKDRMNMVQTHEQYIALHELLVEAFELKNTLISSTTFPLTLIKILPAGKPTNQTKLRKEFENLQTLIPKYDSSCYIAGMMKENKAKNRTMSNVAVDTFRAFLRSQVRGRTDYINAVMLQSHRSKSGYLMTQFPLEDTVDDFWTMVTDYNCENIVVLGTHTEHWLREESEINKTHEVYVKKENVLEAMPDVDIADYLVTSKSSSSDMTIRIFTIKQWSSDSLLPPSDSSLLLLLEQLDSRRRSDNKKPVVVMCRNGCTQSGLFCCVSNARDQMKMDEEVDIFQNARQIQIRRPHALRHIEQYQYCYNLIGQYLESTNVYIN